MEAILNAYKVTYFSATGEVIFSYEAPGMDEDDAMAYVNTFPPLMGVVKITLALIGPYKFEEPKRKRARKST